MVVVTPGVDFIVGTVAKTTALFAATYATADYALPRLGHEDIPPIYAVLALAVGAPLTWYINLHLNEFKKSRRAAALGARTIPQIRGKWPGNIDILRQFIDKVKTGYPGDGIREILAELGPITNQRLVWNDLVLTTCPNHIKSMLATDFNNFVKGKRFHSNMEAVLGTGVFNSDGDMWKFHRSITRPVFVRERITDFDMFDRKAQLVISKLRERLAEGFAVDFQDLMCRFTLDSATEFLFGDSVEALSAGLPYPHNAQYAPKLERTVKGDAANDFAEAFQRAQDVIAFRERLGWVWPFLEIFEDKSKGPMKVVNAYIKPIVQRALEKQRNLSVTEKSKVEEEGTLLDNLVHSTQDPTVLKDEVLNIMIAGRDTTATTLTFIVYFLSIYPEVTARLREEILSKVGHTRRPTYDDIKEMKYLRAVINETLRLYPIVPFNIRECLNETLWPSENPNEKPYYLPPGTRTAYSVFLMHRRPELWGPDAEEFDPDRFLDHRLKQFISKNPFIFLPFNAGPRICLGQQFAYNEMSFMLVRLLQNFSTTELALDAAPAEAIPPARWVEEAGGKGRKAVDKFSPKMHLTMYLNGGLWLRMKESDGSN